MFTGLVEEVGILKQKTQFGSGLRLMIEALRISPELTIGESVNINGACQTVIQTTKNNFTVETVEETLKKTTLGYLKNGERVNLERSLQANARLGGHFVLGHVDTPGEIIELTPLSASHELRIKIPENFSKYIVRVGSIAVEGISLTLADVRDNMFAVAIIPHTWKETNLSGKRVGDLVNLEFDILGKYVAKFLGIESESKLTEEWLKELGY